MKKITSLFFLISLLSGLPIKFRDAEPTEKKKPNFSIIFCDNLGYGDIEPFGSTLHRTPNLNRMAKEGSKFTHFYVIRRACARLRAPVS